MAKEIADIRRGWVQIIFVFERLPSSACSAMNWGICVDFPLIYERLNLN